MRTRPVMELGSSIPSSGESQPDMRRVRIPQQARTRRFSLRDAIGHRVAFVSRCSAGGPSTRGQADARCALSSDRLTAPWPATHTAPVSSSDARSAFHATAQCDRGAVRAARTRWHAQRAHSPSAARPSRTRAGSRSAPSARAARLRHAQRAFGTRSAPAAARAARLRRHAQRACGGTRSALARRRHAQRARAVAARTARSRGGGKRARGLWDTDPPTKITSNTAPTPYRSPKTSAKVSAILEMLRAL
jgi:hypothetical protein